MKKQINAGKILSAISVVVILLFALWAEKGLSALQVRLLQMWGIYVILVASFNLVFGYTGQFSLAHAGLAAIGAYTVSLLTMSPAAKQVGFLLKPPIWPISVVQWPFLPSLIMAGLLAAIVGILIGVPALRLRGDYLLIATFGFSEIIRLLLCNLPMVCNGAMGLKGIPQHTNLAWIWGTAIFAIFVIKRLVDSSYGRALKCIREDEIAAEAVGVSLFYHKVMAFVVSAFFVGIGGALLANLLGTIDPSTFRPYLTYAVITMAVLGGVESLTGSVIAAGIYTLMSEMLRAIESPRTIFNIHVPGIPGLRMLMFAVMLLFLILFYRRGIMGAREFSWRWMFSKLRPLFARAKREGGGS